MRAGDNIKVLHVIGGLRIGGATRLALDTIRWFVANSEHEMRLCVLKAPPEHETRYDAPIPAVHLNYSGQYNNPIDDLICIWKLRALIRKERPQIVHSYLWATDMLTALALIGLDVPHVVHLCDRRPLGRGRLRHRIRKWATKHLLCRQGKLFVAVSDAVRQFFCREFTWPTNKVHVIHNSIDPFRMELADRHARKQVRQVRIGSASRLEPEKGLEHLISAVKETSSSVSSGVRVRIAGDGWYREKLEEHARRLKVDDRVSFVGWVESSVSFMLDSDIFVVPSVSSEGLPSTILEAMYCRCAVVASDVGGTREVIDDGVEGLLVPPGDVRALSAALVRLLNDVDLRVRLGEAGRKRVESGFTIARMCKGIEAVWRDAVEEHRCPR